MKRMEGRRRSWKNNNLQRLRPKWTSGRTIGPINDYQETENGCARGGWADTAYRFHTMAEDARSYREEVRKQVGPAESRLEWVSDQLLLALLAEHAVSTTEVSTAKLPKGASRSGQTTLSSENAVTSSLFASHCISGLASFGLSSLVLH